MHPLQEDPCLFLTAAAFAGADARFGGKDQSDEQVGAGGGRGGAKSARGQEAARDRQRRSHLGFVRSRPKTKTHHLGLVVF